MPLFKKKKSAKTGFEDFIFIFLFLLNVPWYWGFFSSLSIPLGIGSVNNYNLIFLSQFYNILTDKFAF